MLLLTKINEYINELEDRARAYRTRQEKVLLHGNNTMAVAFELAITVIERIIKEIISEIISLDK